MVDMGMIDAFCNYITKNNATENFKKHVLTALACCCVQG